MQSGSCFNYSNYQHDVKQETAATRIPNYEFKVSIN